MIRILFTVLFLLLTHSAWARTFWVSKSASGQHCVDSATDPGAGSSSGTLGQGIQCMASGDTLMIKAGTYEEDLITAGIAVPNGSSSAHTVVQAAPGNTVIFTKNSRHFNFYSGSRQYIDFVGGCTTGINRTCLLNWDGTGSTPPTPGLNPDDYHAQFADIAFGNPAAGGSTNITFDGVRVHDWPNIGLQQGFNNIFKNGRVDHNGQYCKDDGAGGTQPGYAWYMNGPWIIEGSEIDNQGGYGIHQYSNHSSDPDGNIYRNNIFHDNGRVVCPTANDYAAILMQTPSGGHQVYGNVFYNESRGAHPGRAIWGVSCNSACNIYNNTIDTADIGIQIGDDSGNWSVKNNIIVNSAMSNIISEDPDSVFTNNICTTQGGTSNCSLTKTLAEIAFVNSASRDYHLQGISQARDIGTTQIRGTPSPNACPSAVPSGGPTLGITAFTAPCPDIGAFEFTGGAVSAPAVVINSPTSNPTWAVTSATLTLGGTYTANGGTSPVAMIWTCDRCSTGTVSLKGTSWTTSTITLLPGVNYITVRATDTGGSGTAQIIVTYTPPNPGDALVLALGFEGNGTDSSGANNNATLVNGATYTAANAGKFGQALSLNGTNQYGEVADSNSLDLTQSFSMSAWVFPTVARNDFRALIVKNYMYYLYATAQGFCSGDGGPIAGFHTNGSGTAAENFSVCRQTPLPINTWSHVAATYDNTAGQLKFYINGVLVPSSGPTSIGTTPASGIMEPSNGPTATLQIGASQFNENFQGYIDEVRVHNRAIPLVATDGQNTSPGATCVGGDLAASRTLTHQSIIQEMNCPVVPAAPPPITIKFPASASGLKVGSSATGLKFGSK